MFPPSLSVTTPTAYLSHSVTRKSHRGNEHSPISLSFKNTPSFSSDEHLPPHIFVLFCLFFLLLFTFLPTRAPRPSLFPSLCFYLFFFPSPICVVHAKPVMV